MPPGNGGAGRHIRGGGSGDGSCGNNNNNNNNGSGNFGGGGDCDGFGDHLRRCSGPALLGALALVTASAAFPAASRATPVSLSSLLHGTAGSGSSDKAILSSSAPQGGGFGGSLSDSLAPSLQRSSVGATYGPSASFAGSPGPSPGPSPGSPGSGSGRPRSKVMHVACKGSTLVVPLTGHDPKGVDIPLPQPRFLPWQRRKIVDAPVELSEREARMLAARQNRVRDSLLVQ
ncbi:hypothetical protein PLESTF_001655000 [Pleodorina starrii]|nr:hypothetical protein PLESTF_001655000 [Pleodorina starrii]